MHVRIKGRALKTLMLRRNLSRQGLADLTGVSPSLVSLWFGGHRSPSATVRQRLLAVLGVEFDTIFVIRGAAPRSRQDNGDRAVT
jgi:transcriptional regulator with XRE-family HTH domain